MDQELDEMKRINLVEYSGVNGYTVDKSRSTNSSKVMKHANGDKIVIAICSKTGHSIYFSILNDHDNGTIIDFIRNRTGKNLGYIRKELRPWIGKNSEHSIFTAQKPEHSKPVPSSKNRQVVAINYAKTKVVQKVHAYLESRGIDLKVLSDLRFKGKIRIDLNGNAIFPHYDRKSISGYEIKGEKFSGFAKGGEKGLWFSNFNKKDENLVITESAIDALSYHSINGVNKSRYVSIGGSISSKQKGFLKGAIENIHKINGYVICAFDNDNQGKKYVIQIKSLMNPEQLNKIKIHLPEKEGYDWNDILMEK